MVNRMCPSATPAVPDGQPTSGVLADDCTSPIVAVSANDDSSTPLRLWRLSSDPQAASRRAEEKPEKELVGDQLSLRNATNTSKYHEMFLQLETSPITKEQILHEVRGINAGLVMVEKRCIEIDKRQTESKAELSGSQWQALLSQHRTLLYEHCDFFFALQHPSASPELKRLADKYDMPARLWKYGIHSFLELLRQKLPESLEYMLHFIHLAYPMMTLLLERVYAFRDTWIQCLGDMARYRMAVDESDREVWAGVSRFWYHQDTDQSSGVGKIQHHLGVLARPDALLQLFYYTKALVSVRPFPDARKSLILFFDSYHGSLHSLGTAFAATHSELFTRGPTERLITLANDFLALLRRKMRQLGQQGKQGVYMMSCNFASMFQYGQLEAGLAMIFSKQRESATVAEKQALAFNWTRGSDDAGKSHEPMTADSQLSSQVVYHGSSLAFHTLAVFLDQIDDPNAYPCVHTALAFIWCLALHPPAMQQLEQMIPWLAITRFLNTLLRPDIIIPKIENDSFPLFDDVTVQQLPEDFLIRGQTWSQLYYPEKFFGDAPSEDERPIIEKPSTVIPRIHRCLWLGVRIAMVGEHDIPHLLISRWTTS